MKLDRNITANVGKGKYAVVRLRNIREGSAAYRALKMLELHGHLDWGIVGHPDEFFVIKLRDEFANSALAGYADAVMDAGQKEPDLAKAKELAQWALEVQALGHRAGPLSPFCKRPD